MSNQMIAVQFSGQLPVVVSGKVENIGDLRRLFRKADATLGHVAKMFPALSERKVEKVSIRPMLTNK